MAARRFTRTEQMVISGMRLATDVKMEQHRSEFPDQPIVGILLDINQIVMATNVGRSQKVSEHRVRQALRSLERDGLVTRDRLSGMAGGLTFWKISA